jgi:ATP-dependent exoDNAse (exonuclease V) beta subunit
VLDLAFEDRDGWTVLDFKTDRELGTAKEQYCRQVQIYAAALNQAMGTAAKGIILRL